MLLKGTLKNPPSQWLSNARLVHFQALLLNPLRIRYNPSPALKPAILLSDSSLDMQHDCSIVLGHVQIIMSDFTDIPWRDSELISFMYGNSFIQNGIKYIGAVVIDLDSVFWATTLLLELQPRKLN